MQTIIYDGFIHEVVEHNKEKKKKSINDMTYYTMGVIPFNEMVNLIHKKYNSPIISMIKNITTHYKITFPN